MREILVMAVNESYEAELAAVTAPVALVWGAEDGEVRVSVAEAAKALLESRHVPVELSVLPGVGHFVPTQDPSALRRAIDAMLGR
jgi:pimeloyl-ACP methyl ester carboxylesterase